ncbi:SusC/RagA family TonB-linked outer membrane protein [Pedobacter frigiditerrae]|uniref:SusC/RagA family TonB-linked outer membrane protein n=1 Tax=Pedobacter frigiditerrae TaxID=2530452 RepID=UPI002931720A|nr:SusC/RagA family TonB-linked outer membrane protein [Pedobacter frigiditerrae]
MYKFYYTNGYGVTSYIRKSATSLWQIAWNPNIRKWLMRINLTCLMLLIAFMQVSLAANAQKISLSKKNAPLTEIFKELRKQSGYDFVINKDQIKIAKPVTILVNGDDLINVLNKCFENQPFTYSMEDKMIIVVNKKSEQAKINSPPLDVTGKLVDENAQPIAGATIKVKGTSITAISDANGFFSLKNISDDAVLQISYLGYQIKEVKASKDLGSLIMALAVGKLDEVTVNAGYYTVKERELTGSISRITSKDIEKQPVTNFLATMQGRMAGVNIIQQTGTAGGGFNIQIRGQNSVRRDGNSPLYIIDGVPYSSEEIGNGLSMSIMSMNTNPLNNINPGDIESLEVLKDADATAIYGSRGANGVVLISTKKGKKGKTRFNTSLSQGLGSVAHFMKMMNTQQYLSMRAEGFANDGIAQYPANAYDINGTWDKGQYTNWQKELLGGTAKITNINASVSGGSEQTQFMIISNYNRETTVMPGDFGYNKANVRVNLNHTSQDQRFKVSFTSVYNIQDNNQASTDLTVEAWALAPNAPSLYNANGELNWENNTFQNPLRHLNGLSKSRTYDLVANSIFSYSLAKGLDIKSSFGYTDLKHGESSTFPSTIFNPSEGLDSKNSRIYYTDMARQSWIIEPQLNWRSMFGSLKTDLLIGATYQRQNNKSMSTEGSGYSSNSMIYNPSAATDLSILGFDDSVYKYQSVFARANFNWKERYLLNLTGRRDGSSRFGSGKNFAWFGAVGAAWLFSEEKLLKDNSVFSFGKLRASYGTTGNDQIGNYQFLNTYTASSATYADVIGLKPTRLYNDQFRWETNKKLEVALETGFLKDKIFLTTAWYRNRSSNQLVGVPLPGTTGFTEIRANLDATVQNTGVELTLMTKNIERKDFEWNTTINFSASKNKLLSFPNLESSTYRDKYVIGQPLNIVKTYLYDGINPTTGIYTFIDVNSDGQFTEAEDMQTVKDLSPRFFGGLHNHLRYKRWQLDFLFQFVKQQNYDIPRTLAIAGTMINQSVAVLDHWQSPEKSGVSQIYTSGANGDAENALYRYAASDAGITDASYIKLKNVALSYEFPERWLKKIGCKATLQGQNLLTITPFKGSDPEFAGIGYLPPLRMITAGLQFDF